MELALEEKDMGVSVVSISAISFAVGVLFLKISVYFDVVNRESICCYVTGE